MTAEELYKVYAGWSGSLHYYVVKELGRHIDCEYFPQQYEFAIYQGHAEDEEVKVIGFGVGTTVPGLRRPYGERKEVIKLPRPEDEPTREDLDKVFVNLCLAAARVLRIDLGKPKLDAPAPEKHASKRRLRNKSDESPNPRRKNLGAGKKED